MLVLATLIRYLFSGYILLIMVRIIGSWFPAFARHPIMGFIYRLTEPYLGLFRRVIPPIGGVLDLSPLIAFFVLEISRSLILGFLGTVAGAVR
jgi:YggT family protein